MKIEDMYSPQRTFPQDHTTITIGVDPADPLGQRTVVTTVIGDGYAFWMPDTDKFAIFQEAGTMGDPIPRFQWGEPTNVHFLLTFDEKVIDDIIEGLADPSTLITPCTKYGDQTMAMIELLDSTVELDAWTVPVVNGKYDFTKAERV